MSDAEAADTPLVDLTPSFGSVWDAVHAWVEIQTKGELIESARQITLFMQSDVGKLFVSVLKRKIEIASYFLRAGDGYEVQGRPFKLDGYIAVDMNFWRGVIVASDGTGAVFDGILKVIHDRIEQIDADEKAVKAAGRK